MNMMRLRNPSRSRSAVRRAFTLIELLLVLVILGVLAAVVVPKLTGRTEDAKIKAARSSIAGIKAALDIFEVDNGRYPSSDEGLKVLVDRPADLDNWHGPYVDRQQIAADPWGNGFVYRYPGQHNPDGYDLYSMGPDGREGTDDITNWTQQK
jgi:general secretion pathway protein G